MCENVKLNILSGFDGTEKYVFTVHTHAQNERREIG